MVFSGILIVLLLAVSPQRETQVPTIKVGFVDMTKLFNEYHRTKTETVKFEAKFNEEQETLKRKADEVAELQKQLQEQGSSLSEADRRDLEDRIEEASRNVRNYRDLASARLRREKQRIDKEILESLQEAVGNYGTREGYSMIFRESMLLHGAQTFDLTDEILRQVNSQ